jgi:hypothetical protein
MTHAGKRVLQARSHGQEIIFIGDIIHRGGASFRPGDYYRRWRGSACAGRPFGSKRCRRSMIKARSSLLRFAESATSVGRIPATNGFHPRESRTKFRRLLCRSLL